MNYKWRAFKFKFWRWMYRKVFEKDPVHSFIFQCSCGLEMAMPVPGAGTVLQYNCQGCVAKHRMIWLADHWQVSSVFNEEKVEFKPLDLPEHPREKEAR